MKSLRLCHKRSLPLFFLSLERNKTKTCSLSCDRETRTRDFFTIQYKVQDYHPGTDTDTLSLHVKRGNFSCEDL